MSWNDNGRDSMNLEYIRVALDRIADALEESNYKKRVPVNQPPVPWPVGCNVRVNDGSNYIGEVKGVNGNKRLVDYHSLRRAPEWVYVVDLKSIEQLQLQIKEQGEPNGSTSTSE